MGLIVRLVSGSVKERFLRARRSPDVMAKLLRAHRFLRSRSGAEALIGAVIARRKVPRQAYLVDAPLPRIEPCLATLATKPPTGEATASQSSRNPSQNEPAGRCRPESDPLETCEDRRLVPVVGPIADICRVRLQVK